jgi:hypothetical protein
LISFQDGIIQPTDTSLRDFCAVCLREFVKWSIKQTPPKVMVVHIIYIIKYSQKVFTGELKVVFDISSP